MRSSNKNLLKRLATLEQQSPENKPVMMLPPFEYDAKIWSLDAAREQKRLKQSVRNGDISPDYSGCVFPELEPNY